MDINKQGFGHVFPYSNIHELNLDWMLSKLKELDERVTELERWRREVVDPTLEDHEKRITQLEDDFKKLRAEWEEFKVYIEKRMDDFEAEIRQAFEDLKKEIDARFAALKTEIEELFATLKHELEDKFTQLELTLTKQISDNLKYIIEQCATFTERVVKLELRVDGLENQMEECCETIKSKLEELIDAIDEGVPTMDLITKHITENGVYHASEDHADGYSTVTVEVPKDEAVLEEVTISENGVYEAINYTADGFSKATVNVPQSYDAAKDSGNIIESPFTIMENDFTIDGVSENLDGTVSVLNPISVAIPKVEKRYTSNVDETISNDVHVSKITVRQAQPMNKSSNIMRLSELVKAQKNIVSGSGAFVTLTQPDNTSPYVLLKGGFVNAGTKYANGSGVNYSTSNTINWSTEWFNISVLFKIKLSSAGVAKVNALSYGEFSMQDVGNYARNCIKRQGAQTYLAYIGVKTDINYRIYANTEWDIMRISEDELLLIGRFKQPYYDTASTDTYKQEWKDGNISFMPSSIGGNYTDESMGDVPMLICLAPESNLYDMTTCLLPVDIVPNECSFEIPMR